MITIVTPEERLISEACFGLFFANMHLTKKQADQLRNAGLVVADLKDKKNYPRLHWISWKNAVVVSDNIESLDIESLDENSSDYTLAQKLWIISNKNLPESMK